MPARVLVADNLAARLELIKEALELAGFSVLAAEDGVECLLKAQFERPDLVIMEANMPAMGGMQVVRAMRGRPETKRVPIILLTREAEHGKGPAGFVAGDVLCLQKPLRLGALVEAAESMLAGPEAPAREEPEGRATARPGRIPVGSKR